MNLKTLVGIALLPVSASALSLNVVRPEPGEALSMPLGFTFVIGTVVPADSAVSCNGVECEAHEDGAFIGFAPIRLVHEWEEVHGKRCDAQFEFVARQGLEEIRRVVPVYTPRSPSAAVSVQELFDPPKVIRVLQDQWIGLEGENLGDLVFVPQGCVLSALSGNARAYRCRTPQGAEITIPGAEAEESDGRPGEGAQPAELSLRDGKLVLQSSETWKMDEDRSAPVCGLRIAGPGRIQRRWSLRGDGEKVDPEAPLRGLRVCLDPGHHSDRGAVGPRGFEERESNLRLARVVGKLLEAEGARVSFTREEDPLVLKERHARMRGLNPDVVVSIHNNSVGDGEDPRLRHGTQTFYLHPWSRPLAESVHRAMLRKLGTKDLGCIRRNLYLPRFPECPVILVEPEYIILPEQEKKFMDPDCRRKLAEAIVDGIRDFAKGRGPHPY